MLITIFYSPFGVPTRRVALGPSNLGDFTVEEIKASLIVLWVRSLGLLEENQSQEVVDLIQEISLGATPSSRLRCRIQKDTQGLKKLEIRLTPLDPPSFSPDPSGASPQQIVLGILLSIRELDTRRRRQMFRWLSAMTSSQKSRHDISVWARDVLNLSLEADLSPQEVKKAFRNQVRKIHPDNQGIGSGLLMDDLVRARDILIGEKKYLQPE